MTFVMPSRRPANIARVRSGVKWELIMPIKNTMPVNSISTLGVS